MTVSFAQIAAVCSSLLAIGALFTAVAKWLDGRFERQITAVVAQLDTRVEHAVSAAQKAASDALRAHDENQIAHANHSNPQRYRTELGDLARAISELATKLAVIETVIRTGQEAAAVRWDGMETRLDAITDLEHRLSKVEGEHAAFHVRSGGRS